MSTEKVVYLLELRDKFSKTLGTANKGLNQLDRNAGAASLSLGKVKGVLAGLGVGMVAKEIFTAGMNMEQTRVAFATFLKDAEKGNRVIGELNKFSNITPFDNAEVIKSGRVLLAANVPAEKLTGILKNVGDVASGAQVPLTELSSIYAKVMNKGKAQAEELNQMSERGIPILQVLADQYNITREEIMKMGSQGKITSDVIAGAFQSMTSEGGMFFNMMEKQSATTGGKLSTLKGSLGLLAAELGESANPAIGGLIDKLIDLVNYLRENKDMIISVVKWVGRGAAAFVAYKATVFATQKAVIFYNAAKRAAIITNILFTKGLKKARVAMRLFNVTTKANPIGLIVSGLTLLLPLLKKHFDVTKHLNAEQRVAARLNSRHTEIYTEQAAKLKVLSSQLKQGNLTQKERGKIIKELNSSYGQYLDNLLTEEATEKEIAEAIKKINVQLKQKALIQAIEEDLVNLAKERLKIIKETANTEEMRSKAYTGVGGFLKTAYQSLKVFGEQGRVLTAQEAMASSLKEEYKGQFNALKENSKEMDYLLSLQRKMGTEESNIQKKRDAKGERVVGLDKQTAQRLETGIKAGAPKIININIDKLVESFNIETKQITEAPIRVREEMTKVLLDSINDAALMQG